MSDKGVIIAGGLGGFSLATIAFGVIEKIKLPYVAISQNEQLSESWFNRTIGGNSISTHVVSGNVIVNGESSNYLRITETANAAKTLDVSVVGNYSYDHLSGQSSLSASAAQLVTQADAAAQKLTQQGTRMPAQSGFAGNFSHCGVVGDALNYLAVHCPQLSSIAHDYILPVAPIALPAALITVGYYANKRMIENLGYEQAQAPKKPNLATRIKAQVRKCTNGS